MVLSENIQQLTRIKLCMIQEEKKPRFSFLTSFTFSTHALNFAWACFSWAKELVR